MINNEFSGILKTVKLRGWSKFAIKTKKKFPLQRTSVTWPCGWHKCVFTVKQNHTEIFNFFFSHFLYGTIILICLRRWWQSKILRLYANIETNSQFTKLRLLETPRLIIALFFRFSPRDIFHIARSFSYYYWFDIKMRTKNYKSRAYFAPRTSVKLV